MPKKELLFSITKKDFIIQHFCSGGKGGQHQNKTETGTRIIHKESGAVGESRSERSQHTNTKLAFEHLVKSSQFRLWHARKVQEVLTGLSIEEQVEKQMNEKNLKFEIKVNGKWIEVFPNDIEVKHV